MGNIIKSYNKYILLEKFDDNIIKELKRLGVKNKEDINAHLYHAHRGNLSKYLNEKGDKFTFGMLHSLFEDAIEAKKRTDIKVGVIKAAHRIIPLGLSPFFPIFAIIGLILGTSRAFNKIISPIISDPGNDYPTFLKKVITSTMNVAEGELTKEKDRFTRAFVIEDKIVEAIDEKVLREFSIFLSNKMSKENKDKEVPEHYIENELKEYLNRNFHIDPKIPTKS